MTIDLTPNSSPDLESAIAGCLIPIGRDEIAAIASSVSQWMGERGVEADDQAFHLAGLLRDWKLQGAPPPALVEVFTAAMDASGDAPIRSLARSYFPTHKVLTEQQLAPESASALLSEASVMYDLATSHNMSASQIATVLSARGASTHIPWKAVQSILSALSAKPILKDDEKTAVLAGDHARNMRSFADDRWGESIDTVSQSASALGFRGDIASLLAELVTERGAAHWPYVAVLHLCLIPLGKYDHDPSYLYEFRPRGRWVESEFLPAYGGVLTTSASPVLNNFKSVDQLGPWWSDPRSEPGAPALVAIVGGLGTMPAQAKRELGAMVRSWCLRQVSLFTPPKSPPPPAPDRAAVGSLLASVSRENTQTRGIVEQRLVDAVSMHRHASDWRVRGLGDSVNAANLPRRKLGDIEFQDAQSRKVKAFEAHGGRLTADYVAGHMRSLDRLIELRVEEEWGTAAGWGVTVTFVAHDTSDLEDHTIMMHDVPVGLAFRTYETWLEGTSVEALVDAITKYVWEPICATRTPTSVRVAYGALTGEAR